MKKIIVALLALAVMASVAVAGVGIDWLGYWGGYNNTVANPLTSTASADSIRAGHSVIWQLVFAGADNAADIASVATGGANGDYVTDDDVVLATRTMVAGAGMITAPEDGTAWDEFLYGVTATGDILYGNMSWSYGEGYVYQRVFQDTPAALSWYYTSGLLQVDTGWDNLVPDSQQVFYTEHGYLGWDNESPENRGYKPLDQFPVPEPATMSLLGLGALVMAIRRRRS